MNSITASTGLSAIRRHHAVGMKLTMGWCNASQHNMKCIYLKE